MPYDDIRFFTAVQYLANPWYTPSYFVLVEERRESVDLHTFKQTMDARVLAEHPIWCLVANFRKERPYGQGGHTIVPGGTKHFSAGAKVYCLPPDRGDGYETVPIIARHRVSHRYIKTYTNSAWLENWRVKRVYEPVLMTKLLGPWDWTAESRELAEQLAMLGSFLPSNGASLPISAEISKQGKAVGRSEERNYPQGTLAATFSSPSCTPFLRIPSRRRRRPADVVVPHLPFCYDFRKNEGKSS